MTDRPDIQRSLGLLGATGVGVGAIVGGGILALAGVAFAATGPSAIVAFALNGLIAVLTALSFAELATQFPESGGTYAFAKKVLTVEAAFSVGWVVWFASIVAAVLYAFGFGAFAVIALGEVYRSLAGEPPDWLVGRGAIITMAVAATLVYTVGLTRRVAGGGQWLNVGKVLVFSVLIATGLWALAGKPAESIREHLSPFFAGGVMGLFRAMGYTFIALQGFDLIAAVSGDIRDPRRTIPRAMFLSLGAALAIYLPLLFVVATVGVAPGGSIAEASAEQPEAIVAIAARQYLGTFGYWLVVAAAVLSMLSALQANLLAASRIARAMARDRTLPHWLEVLHPRHGTPVAAALMTAAIIIGVLVLVPDVAAIGAASSLVFLVTFALAHRITIMARRRGGVAQPYFRTPWFPLIPSVGALACAALAVFQGIYVPTAGMIVCVWLALGGILYASLFGRRARTMDAYTQALDAELVRLRGRSPLVLVPIANPYNAAAMVGVATALATPKVGRVILLSIVSPPNDWQSEETPPSLETSQSVIRGALTASFAQGLAPETLTTVAADPWSEMVRVARIHRCESLLLGLSSLTEPGLESRLEVLMGQVDCDVAILRAPPGWLLRNVRRVLVPLGGRGGHDELRARLLASIHRLGARETTLLRVLPSAVPPSGRERAAAVLRRLAKDEVPGMANPVVMVADDVAEVVTRHAADADLVVLGLKRLGQRRKVFGDLALRVARETNCGIIMIGRRR
ncbi:MAG: amino acid permease [Planctomycetes bacterium]|nr:amino acid permease [Planctomycetota bacterium]